MNAEKIKTELIEVGVISLYFFLCFALFMIIKKLLLLEHDITFYGWATAVVGALVMGKVVFLIDITPMRKWLKNLKPINEIVFKAMVYTLLVFAVSILEKSIHYWLESPTEETWGNQIFGDGKDAMLFAHAIYIYFCFIVFYFLHFLNEEFGRENILKRLTQSR